MSQPIIVEEFKSNTDFCYFHLQNFFNKHKKIMIVDDFEFNLIAFKMVLEKINNLEVLEARDGINFLG